MIIWSELKENIDFIMNNLSLVVPNLSHLNNSLKLIEINPAFNLALEEVYNIYLGINYLGIDIKLIISLTNNRIKKEQYIQVYRLKIILVYLIDQPIRFLYLQSGELPQIKIILEENNSLIQLKVYISYIYEPSEYSLYCIQKQIDYNNGNVRFFHQDSSTVWLISFYAEN